MEQLKQLKQSKTTQLEMNEIIFSNLKQSLNSNDIENMIKYFNLLPNNLKEELVNNINSSAKIFYKENNYPKAQELYYQVYLVKKDDSSITNYALCLYKQSKYDEVIKFLDNNKLINNNKWKFIYGNTLYELKRYLECIDYFKHLINNNITESNIQTKLKYCLKLSEMINNLANGSDPANTNPTQSKSSDIPNSDELKINYPKFNYKKLKLKPNKTNKWYESNMAKALNKYLSDISLEYSIKQKLKIAPNINLSFIKDIKEQNIILYDTIGTYLLGFCNSESKYICIESNPLIKRLINGFVSKYKTNNIIIIDDYKLNESDYVIGSIDYTIMSIGRKLLKRMNVPTKIIVYGQTVKNISKKHHAYVLPVKRSQTELNDDRFIIDIFNSDQIQINLDHDQISCGIIYWFELYYNDLMYYTNYDEPAMVFGNKLNYYIVHDNIIEFGFDNYDCITDNEDKIINYNKLYHLEPSIKNDHNILILGNVKLNDDKLNDVKLNDVKLNDVKLTNINTKQTQIKNPQMNDKLDDTAYDIIVHNLFDTGGLGAGVLHLIPYYRDHYKLKIYPQELKIYPQKLKIYGQLIEKRFDNSLLNPYLWSSNYEVLDGSYIELSEAFEIADYDLETYVAKSDTKSDPKTDSKPINIKIKTDGIISAYITWYETEEGTNRLKTIKYIQEKRVEKDSIIDFKIINDSTEIHLIPQYESKIIRFDPRIKMLSLENEKNWKSILDIIINDPQQFKQTIQYMENFIINPLEFDIIPEIANNIYTILSASL